MSTTAKESGHARRMWVGQKGGSVDLRYGSGNLKHAPHQMHTALGKSHRCLLLTENSFDPAVSEDLVRRFKAEGFTCAHQEMPGGDADLAQVAAVCALLQEHHMVPGDLVVVAGALPAISAASFVTSSWRGGVALGIIPTDPVSALHGGITPLAISAGEAKRAIVTLGSARFEIIDADLYDPDPASEINLQSFVHMVIAAMLDGDKAFGSLWDAADDLAAGDRDVFLSSLTAAIKSRGKAAASSAAATRQTLSYGRTFARALRSLTGDEVLQSVAYAEGLRFSARIAVAKEKCSIDDMFTQDELLERLGLGICEISVDPEALAQALCRECMALSRRFMLEIPISAGRVRAVAVDEELLREHCRAWCAQR